MLIPEKKQFTFSYLLLLLNEVLATVVHTCVTFRINDSNIFYTKIAQRSRGKLWLIHHVAVLQNHRVAGVGRHLWRSFSPTQNISHWFSVVSISFFPSYRTESGYWSSNMLCPSYHNDDLKIQKRNNNLNFDRNIVFKTWSLLKYCTGSVSRQPVVVFLVYRAAS